MALILPEQPLEKQQHRLVHTHIMNGIHKTISNPNKTSFTIKKISLLDILIFHLFPNSKLLLPFTNFINKSLII